MPDPVDNQNENQEPTHEEQEEEENEGKEAEKYEDRVHNMFTGVMVSSEDEEEED